MKRTFLYSDDKSSKFWDIEINGSSFTVNYGKAGTNGQAQTKDFADDAACQKAADKLIAEKTKKGYVEQGDTSAPITSVATEKPGKATEIKEAKPKETRQAATTNNMANGAKRVFLYSDDKSSKFWDIEINGNSFTVNYGKAGTNGQTQTKDFADDAACQKAAEKLIAEKTKKGYVEQAAGVELPKPAKGEFKIPKYKEREEADIEQNQFVVNLKKPESIAAALKYQIDNVDEFLERFDELASDGEPGVSFGAIEDEEFVPFSEMDKYTDKDMYYDEEIITSAIVKFPELQSIVVEYIEKVIIPASENEETSGPWSTEETILGEFIIPAMAMLNKEYIPFLEKFMEVNIEIRYTEKYKRDFAQYLEQAKAK